MCLNRKRKIFFQNYYQNFCSLYCWTNKIGPLNSLSLLHYTPGIYAAGYIVFALTFVRSSVRMFVRSFVRSLLSVTFVEFTTKFLVKVSLSEYISLTTHQKAFIFEPWVPERVSFYTMSFCPRVDAPGWG